MNRQDFLAWIAAGRRSRCYLHRMEEKALDLLRRWPEIESKLPSGRAERMQAMMDEVLSRGENAWT